MARDDRRARPARGAGLPVRAGGAARARRDRRRRGRPPPARARDRGAQGGGEPLMRLIWIGHSTVVIELDGTRLVTDPVLRDRVNVLRRVSGPAGAPRDAAAVPLSHLHYAPLDLPSLRRPARSVRVFVPVGGAKLL